MSKYIRSAISLLFLMASFAMQAQRFFNLTYDQVRVDSILPHFGHAIPLTGNYQDSIYTASIVYPEFAEMTRADIANYNANWGKQLPEMPQLEQRIVLDRKRAMLNIGFCPLVFRDNRYQMLVGFMLKVEAKPLKRTQRKTLAVTRATPKAARYANNSVLATGRWAKIRVPASGVYQITESLIRQAGFNDMNKVKVYGYGGNLQNERLEGAELQAKDDLKEVATCFVGGKRLFYAKGPVSWENASAAIRTRNPYSDYGYYFLTQSDGEPLRVDESAFLNSFYPSADDYHSLHEVDNFSWYPGGRNLFENTPINRGTKKSYTIDAPIADTGGSITVTLSAGTATRANISINGKRLGEINVSIPSKYDKGNRADFFANIEQFAAKNEVTIEVTQGGPARLDFISIATSKPRNAPDLHAATFPTPQYVHNITTQNLHAHGAADMVMVIPTSQKLRQEAERLKAFHEKHDGMRVRIVPADELYNEFASGTPDANAYRRYLKMLYDRAESEADQPKYLLLFGDCAWDNRMKTGDWRTTSVDDYLLCFESENSFNEITCYVDDGFFTLLDDGEGTDLERSDLQDVAVGRFPVVHPNDARTMVDKTIAYAQNANAGAWQNTIMFMGDDGNDNLHMSDANKMADSLATEHPQYLIKKVMWDMFKRESSATGHTYPEVTSIIKQQQAAGALVMNYVGHGRTDQISHESVLRLNDFKAFSNTNLPLWITASCDIMPFDGAVPTIGEAAVLNKNGGAVAFFGTTRTVYAYYNQRINMAYLHFLFSENGGKPMTIGEAQRLAKNYMITDGQDKTTNKLQYSLLGDPALAINRPTARVVVDSINGTPVQAAILPKLAAGKVNSIVGHVEGHANLAGVVTATVRDRKQHLVGRLNNQSPTEGADKPFKYTDRVNTIFNGADSVRNGQFRLNFAVPRDVDNDNGTGLVTLYAVNNERTIRANGHSERFTIGSGTFGANDSIGPSIYCYLNSTSFTNGGNVTPQPLFVAKISDKDGLNATGSGIGHDMQLVIDGSMHKTYNLNDYFTFDFGSYTAGTVMFNIPTLSPGKHKLQFRASDIQNNTSQVTLDFHVVGGLMADNIWIDATENPARTTTTFIVSHDMGNTPVDITIEVFDMTGKLLWTNEERGTQTVGNYTRTWDLVCTDGHVLSTGVYLYRAKVAAQGTAKISKARKLIVQGKR